MPKLGGYDFALVVTCGLTRFTRVFPRTKCIAGEDTIKILMEEWFCVYGAPNEIDSDEDIRVQQQTSTPHRKAPAQRHSTAQQNTARRTKQPTPNRGTTQQDGGHRTPPGATAGGRGGGTAPARNAQSALKAASRGGTKKPNQTGAKAKGTEKTRRQQEDTGKRAAGRRHP